VDGAQLTFNGVMLPAVTLALPPPVTPGDVALVVAPSSPFARDDLWPGLAWLRTRYRLRMSPGALVRDGYLAGDDARRHAELTRAILDDEVKVIIVARGGYGAMRIADELPWGELTRRPKWIVGFSDVTVLHAMAWRSGVASVHGPNAIGLGRLASPAVRAAWVASIERPTAVRVWRGLRVVRPGRAAGMLIGGNLALLHALAAANRLVVPPGAVLALEDVGERPYRVDRMLTSLLLGGHLARASAIVFGAFEQCEAAGDGRRTEEVMEDRTRSLGVPVLAGAPFGHGSHNEAFVLGAHARIFRDEVHLGG
jgi:muramoyltetrapeptide carboxypeptidase